MSISHIKKYKKIEQLGRGGNAQVWLVKNKSGVEYALKELKSFTGRKGAIRKKRFQNEIDIMQKNWRKIKGILPVIDSSKKEMWYVMPIAKPILDYIKEQNINIYETIDIFISFSKTLSALHEMGISHRDIKPDNLYYYDNSFCFGDFGLVEIPDNDDDLTKDERKLGPTFTIAPEMKRDPEHSDGKKADVYSLAKTLWILLTRDEMCFEGTYNFLDESHSLRNFEAFKTTHLVELEELITKATDNNPTLRPSAEDFYKSLIEWKEISQDEEKSQYSSWNFINKYLFGVNRPRSAIWDESDEIVSVLNLIIQSQSYSHILFSSQGGNDFVEAEKANEEDYVYIYDSLNNPSLLKPKALYYERFANSPEWSYFLLEIENVNPILSKTISGYEMLVEDYPAHYVSAEYYQYGVYDYDSGEKLPEGSKLVYRYFSGKFLFVLKYGPYNRISSVYDGRHANLTNEQIRKYTLNLISVLQKYISKGIDEKVVLKSFRKPNEMSETQMNEYRNEIEENEKLRKVISENYKTWSFESLIKEYNEKDSKIKFFFSLDLGTLSRESLEAIVKKKYIVLCKDGLFKERFNEGEVFYLYNRDLVQGFRDQLYNYVLNNILKIKCPIDDFVTKNILRFDFSLSRNGMPKHLFSCEEIENVLRNGDDRVSNTLVIDENGYAKLIQGNSLLRRTYPVAFESWDAGNIYVGKFADLSDVKNCYLNALYSWIDYLTNDHHVYADILSDDLDEQVLLDDINTFYK